MLCNAHVCPSHEPLTSKTGKEQDCALALIEKNEKSKFHLLALDFVLEAIS